MTLNSVMRRASLVGASVLLIVATLPPIDVGWAGLALLLPVLFALNNTSGRDSALFGLCWGALVGAYMYWGVAAYSKPVFVLTILVVAVVSAGLFLCTALVLRKGGFQPIAGIPLLWVTGELVLNVAGIPYSLSVLIAELPWVIQPAKIGGQHFVALLVYSFQTTLFLWFTRAAPRSPVLYAAGLTPLAITLLAPFLAAEEPVNVFNASAVQTNSHPYDYIYRAADGVLEASTATRSALTTDIPAQTDLVVWPEWAVLGYQFRFPEAVGVTPDSVHLVNAQDLSPAGERLNIVAALDGPDRYQSVSGKANLIPFIEQSFTAAESVNVHREAPGSPVSSICYESVFSRAVAASVRDGGGVIAILTSDAFAGPSLIPVLHSRYARLRAVENNRYVVRAANGGVSMIVSNRGERLASLPLFTRGVISAQVKEFANLTPYTRYASAWWWIFVLGGVTAATGAVLGQRHAVRVASEHASSASWVFVLLAASGFGVALIWGQGVFVSSQLQPSGDGAQPQSRYSLFFTDAYDRERFTYRDTQAVSPSDSMQSALAYVLRSYGLVVTTARLSPSYAQALELFAEEYAALEAVAGEYGFTLTTKNIMQDTLTLPLLAVMNDAEVVVVDGMDENVVSLFSPVNGRLELSTEYFLDRLRSPQVVFVTPPPRSWDKPDTPPGIDSTVTNQDIAVE